MKDAEVIQVGTRQAMTCCCRPFPGFDARTCAELRYHGRSPAFDPEQPEYWEFELCECACHEDDVIARLDDEVEDDGE